MKKNAYQSRINTPIELFTDVQEDPIILTGNQAYARGLFEASVSFLSMYPGTPISEIGDLWNNLSQKRPQYQYDLSVNEKVAFEAAVGAAWTGVRAAVAFKHLGMNVISDALHSVMYSGVQGNRKAGLLIICGGDPEIKSSTNAQDVRLFSLHSKLPILTPSSVQECKDFVKLGFELSEYLSLPIMIYSPALLNHSSGLVQLETPDPEREKRIENMKHMGTYRKFIKDPDKFLNAIHWAQKNQNTLFSIIDELKEQKISDKYYEKIISPNTNFRIQVNTENENNRSLPITKKGGEQKRKKSENKRIAFIGEGICWSYLLEIQRCLGIELSALRLKLIYPVSEKLVLSFLQESKAEILVILEEQEDFIENQIKNIIYDLQSQSKISDQPVIIGKSAFPRIGGLSEDIIIDSLAKPLNIEKSRIIIKEFQDILSKKEQIQMIKGIQKELPIREPTFCPGCSHRNVFYALKRASNRYKKETGIQPVYGGDIGCYTMSMSEPYGTMDYLICMGAGVGIANGIGRSMDQEKQHLIAMIGDSTFFHSGIQPIINLAQKNINVLVLILNNYYTAMTGHQDSPSTPATQQPVIEESANHQLVKNNVRFTKHSRRTISIKKILKSLGNFPIKELDGYSIERMKRSFQRLFRIPGLKFALVNAECALHKGRRIKFLKKNLKGKHSEIKVNISDFCTKCDECFEVLGCTAIQESEDKYYIDESRCMGEFCLSCLEVCPNHAIFKTHLNPTEPRIDKIKEQIMDERMSKNN